MLFLHYKRWTKCHLEWEKMYLIQTSLDRICISIWKNQFQIKTSTQQFCLKLTRNYLIILFTTILFTPLIILLVKLYTCPSEVKLKWTLSFLNLNMSQTSLGHTDFSEWKAHWPNSISGVRELEFFCVTHPYNQLNFMKEGHIKWLWNSWKSILNLIQFFKVSGKCGSKLSLLGLGSVFGLNKQRSSKGNLNSI